MSISAYGSSLSIPPYPGSARSADVKSAVREINRNDLTRPPSTTRADSIGSSTGASSTGVPSTGLLNTVV